MDEEDLINWDDLDFDSVPPPDFIASDLEDIELVDRYTEVKDALLDRQEGLNPTTEEGRRLHSERTALLVELAKRELR